MAVILTGATVGVKGYVLDMAERVVARAGYHTAIVTSGFRPGSITAAGRASLHGKRQAVDIGATGNRLIRLGRAALQEAGWQGALPDHFAGTANGWEIAFNIDLPNWGDHTDHLHLGWEGADVPHGAVGGTSPQAHYDFPELMRLWVEEGGAPGSAAMAAQVATLESRGNPHAHNKTFREDSRGLWQINVKSNAHPEYASADLFNPRVNVRAAIKISGNGRSWSQWSTMGAARALLASRPASEKKPPAVVNRPGGEKGHGGGGGLFPGVGSFLTNLPGGDLLFGGGLFGAQGGIAGGGGGPGIGDLIGLVIWLFSPHNFLRAIEFLVGSALMLLGLATLIVEFAKQDTLIGSAAGGVVRAGQRYTPTGRLSRYYSESRRRTGGPSRAERISNRPRPVYSTRRRAGPSEDIPY